MSTRIREIDPATLKNWLDTDRVTLIDVREADEHARERIAGSRLAPLSRFDPLSIPQSNGKATVLYCRSGRRSSEAARHLLAAGHAEPMHLAGGIEGWKAAGFAAEFNTKAPISIMRQVQITIGAAVLAGSVLAATVSPWFLLLTGFMGAGLLFAGLSGTCGLASVLARMPWNSAAKCGDTAVCGSCSA